MRAAIGIAVPRRHPPRLWLMTDERLGDSLWTALDNLPPGAGIVFRHYRTPLAERRRLFAGVQAIADRRGLVLVRAGADRLAARERSEERTSELQSLMRISYAVLCLKKKTQTYDTFNSHSQTTKRETQYRSK